MTRGSEREIWSVAQLVAHLSKLVDQDEQSKAVWVEGELSNFTHHASGHMYFTLKDESAKMRAVMFKWSNRLLLFKPKNGDRVMIRGELYVYERDGQVQLKVLEMRNSGLGDLYSKYIQLKEKLETEGLFHQPKKILPSHPRKVGVITSSHGAAVRDIITTMKRRYPLARILLMPVAVQGVHAAKEVATAIDEMNRLAEVDLLIVGRGGGSLEELWAFNEEIVVRSIAQSVIPVISAVGHETDTTLSDFAADVRAATPTAAAELAVPNFEELEHRFAALYQRLQNSPSQLLNQKREQLDRLAERPVLRQPGAQLDQFSQRLDYLDRDLYRLLRKKMVDLELTYERSTSRLRYHRPHDRIRAYRERILQLQKEQTKALNQKLHQEATRYERSLAKLDALSPLKVLQRGYSVAFRFQGELVRTVNQVRPGDLLRVRVSDGVLKCQVFGSEEINHE